MEEEIEAALALQALAQGIDSNTVARRWIKAPKSLKARIKSQPEAALAMPLLPKLKIPNLSNTHEAMLAARLDEIEEHQKGSNEAEPIAKRVRALRMVRIQKFPTSESLIYVRYDAKFSAVVGLGPESLETNTTEPTPHAPSSFHP